MLSIDLFDSKFERRLHEGAVDDAEYALLKKLGEKIDYLKQAKSKTKDPEMKRAIDGRIKQYDDERMRILSVRGMNETQPPQRPPAKGLLKGKDLITPQQRVTGATPQKPGVMGAVKDVVGGIKRFVKGEPDQGPTYESDGAAGKTLQQDIYDHIIKSFLDDQDYISIPFPDGQKATMTRGQMWNAMVALGQMKDPRRRSKYYHERFADFETFMQWLGGLKRYKTPAKKKTGQLPLGLQPKGLGTTDPQPTAPGSPLMDPEFTGLKEADRQKKKSKGQVAEPQQLSVQRYLTQIRRKHPAATSDIEALTLDQMSINDKQDATIDRLQKDLRQAQTQNNTLSQTVQSLGSEVDSLSKSVAQPAPAVAKPAEPVATAPGKAKEPEVKAEPVKDKKEKTKEPAPEKPEPVAIPVPPDVVAQDQEARAEIQRLNQQIQQLERSVAQRPADTDLQDRIAALEKERAEQQARRKEIVAKAAATRQARIQRQPAKDMGPAVVVPPSQIGMDLGQPDLGDLLSQYDVKPDEVAVAKTQSAIEKAKQTSKKTAKKKQKAAVDEHGGGIGPRQRWQDLMPEGEMSKIDIMRQDLDLMNDVQFLRAHGLSKVAFKQKYRTLLKPAPQQDMPVDEGWSDKYGGVMRPPTPYSVYIKGKKWKDFATDDHAQAVANKLKAKFKADGRDPETVTIAPTDMTEDLKKSAKAAALAACIAAGGTLSGCATNPSVQGTIGTVRDVGTAVKTAKDMTRAGVQDELNQELRNFIRAQGGDPGSQNLSLLYKLQKRLQGKKEPPQAVYEVKDTPAVERAIIERIMVTDRPFMIKYGPEKVMSAAEDVAYNVGDVGAFGKHDLDNWVHQVKQILGATP